MSLQSFDSPRPAFECSHHKESQHCLEDVVIIKLVPRPEPPLHNHLSINEPLVVNEECSLARSLVQLGSVRTHPKFSLKGIIVFFKSQFSLKLNLEKLDAYDSEHEEQKDCDQHDVTDCLDRDNDALDNVLQSLGPIDSSVK